MPQNPYNVSDRKRLVGIVLLELIIKEQLNVESTFVQPFSFWQPVEFYVVKCNVVLGFAVTLGDLLSFSYTTSIDQFYL
jgi:hypothetical protein